MPQILEIKKAGTGGISINIKGAIKREKLNWNVGDLVEFKAISEDQAIITKGRFTSKPEEPEKKEKKE